MGRVSEASIAPSFYCRRFPSIPFARRALADRGWAAQPRRTLNESGCAGSPECLLEIEIWPQLLDRAIEARPGRAHRTAHNSGYVLERHVEIEIEDDHETVLMAQP